ncbi:hypothetical protein MUY27_04730 [Mucilaginibacter sp. RS28]|uniref:Agarase n=1 Tax=Mucilaginibacter straminoryzae TaxID=2932774 RepID=A0A9X1X0J0_9SPHI|nr:hypothetical protein [Mucilaginibacter straminoryzae]MCJ8209002.1 hypothetical protein [Mucilaginibacter straminoryzae]
MIYKKYLAPLGVLAIFSNTALCQQKQSGNYRSESVEARVWSLDKDRNSVYSDWKPFETRLVGNITDFTPLKEPDFDTYGFDKSKRFKATNFFRTEKIDGRWWIIDPQGHPGTNVSINSVVKGNSERNEAAFRDDFKNDEDWTEKTGQQLEGLGFNGIGAWSAYKEFIKANKKASKPVSYCVILNFMSSYSSKRGKGYKAMGNSGHKKGLIYAFDREFPSYCEEVASQIEQFKDDPNLFGYFTDNEIPFAASNIDEYLAIPDEDDPNRQAALAWLKQKGISENELTPQLRNEFMAFAADSYYRAVTAALKHFDKNHLILGTRLYRNEKNTPEFMTVAGKYCDVISINYYGAWTPSVERMHDWGEWSGKPFIITEFYTKGMDTGFPNMSGAGWQVKTQEDRGKAYQNFCLGLLESKNCVGWHWFKYQDNDPQSKKSGDNSNTDSNKGLVDNRYQLYDPLATKMRELNINRYRLIKYFDALPGKNN